MDSPIGQHFPTQFFNLSGDLSSLDWLANVKLSLFGQMLIPLFAHIELNLTKQIPISRGHLTPLSFILRTSFIARPMAWA